MKKLSLLLVLAISCLFNANAQNEKASIAVQKFAATTTDTHKKYADVIQQLVVEILRKKSGVQLIDRTDDSEHISELRKGEREESVNVNNAPDQGHLLIGNQMLTGTLSNVSVKENRSSSITKGITTTHSSYTADINFAIKLSDVETGKLLRQHLFGVSKNFLDKLKNNLSASSEHDAIENAIKSTRKDIVKWFNEIYPPAIDIFKVEERDKRNKPATVLVTGVDDSYTKGSHFTVHEIEILNAGDKKLRRVKKVARLKIIELQGDITVCKIVDGEDVLEEKINNKTPMVFTAG